MLVATILALSNRAALRIIHLMFNLKKAPAVTTSTRSDEKKSSVGKNP